MEEGIGDQSFTSLQTQSLEESEAELDQEEQDLHKHVNILNGSDISLDDKVISLKYLRKQVKNVNPEKVFRLLTHKYLDILNDQIRLPVQKTGKEAIYNLCGLLKLQKDNFSFKNCNLMIEKVVSLGICERLTQMMGYLMQNEKFGKLLNKVLWLNIELVNYCQHKQFNQPKINFNNQQNNNNNNNNQIAQVDEENNNAGNNNNNEMESENIQKERNKENKYEEESEDQIEEDSIEQMSNDSISHNVPNNTSKNHSNKVNYSYETFDIQQENYSQHQNRAKQIVSNGNSNREQINNSRSRNAKKQMQVKKLSNSYSVQNSTNKNLMKRRRNSSYLQNQNRKYHKLKDDQVSSRSNSSSSSRRESDLEGK